MKTNAPIAATEVRFRSLFENTPELILYQNEESIILDANPAFLKLVGEPKEKVINRNYEEFLPQKVHALFREKLREAFTGKTIRFDMYASQGDSAPRHWDVVKVPLMENEKVVGVHMMARDITEKMETQERNVEQNKDLQQFTYIVSHNLRGPLSNALGFVDLLGTEEPGTSEFKDIVTHLKTSLNQLDRVMEDMNTILAIRNKEGLTEQHDVLLAEVMEQVVQNLQEALTECGGTVQLAIPDGFEVQANRAYLYSIFFNLLSNAIKYRSDQRPLQVNLVATDIAGQSKMITFTDNGSGINMEQAGEDIFKLYKRFHPKHPGRGVGLYLVKTHIESMGGRIEVNSIPNEGTRFSISIN